MTKGVCGWVVCFLCFLCHVGGLVCDDGDGVF